MIVTHFCQHCKGDAAECGGKTFIKNYECSQCGTTWEDTWCCACNDRCPNCDTETEPNDYELVETELEKFERRKRTTWEV